MCRRSGAQFAIGRRAIGADAAERDYVARRMVKRLGFLVLLMAVASRVAAETPSQAGADIRIEDKHEAQKRTEVPGASGPAREEIEPASEPPKKEDDDDPGERKFTLSGYVESFYQWNFNRPSNGISNYRGFDTRHNSLTISNAVLDSGFRARDLLGRLALQVGHTPATVYQEEPDAPGSDGAGPSNAALWRFLQRASVGWQVTHTWLLEAGLFLTNVGVESVSVKDNWNWSRTNAFVRLPTYQTGAKVTYRLSDRADLIGGVFNGWSSVVDNNGAKSILLQAQLRVAERLSASFAYFSGIERDPGAPEGGPWRHAFDGYIQLDASRWLQLAAEVNGGWERTRFGFHPFAGSAAYTRIRARDWLYVAGRLDGLWERPARATDGQSEPFLLPVRYVVSATGTLDLRPTQGLSCRLEVRRDSAERELYFQNRVSGDGSTAAPYVPNARSQTTVLAGMVVWF